MCYRKRIKSSSSEIELNGVWICGVFCREHHLLCVHTMSRHAHPHTLTFDPTEREITTKWKQRNIKQLYGRIECGMWWHKNQWKHKQKRIEPEKWSEWVSEWRRARWIYWNCEIQSGTASCALPLLDWPLSAWFSVFFHFRSHCRTFGLSFNRNHSLNDKGINISKIPSWCYKTLHDYMLRRKRKTKMKKNMNERHATVWLPKRK